MSYKCDNCGYTSFVKLSGKCPGCHLRIIGVKNAAIKEKKVTSKTRHNFTSELFLLVTLLSYMVSGCIVMLTKIYGEIVKDPSYGDLRYFGVCSGIIVLVNIVWIIMTLKSGFSSYDRTRWHMGIRVKFSMISLVALAAYWVGQEFAPNFFYFVFMSAFLYYLSYCLIFLAIIGVIIIVWSIITN